MIRWRARVHQQRDFALSVTYHTNRGNSGTRRSPGVSPAPNRSTPQNCRLSNFISRCLGLHFCRPQSQPSFVVVGDDMVQLSQ
jgi:hypothetical protein